MMTAAFAKEILLAVAFPGYTFEVHGDFYTVTYLQATFMAPRTDLGGAPVEQKTRKWLLSAHMTRSELVQTAFKCALTSLEHEAREQFTYKGAPIFGPHFDVEGLVDYCGLRALDTREVPA